MGDVDGYFRGPGAALPADNESGVEALYIGGDFRSVGDFSSAGIARLGCAGAVSPDVDGDGVVNVTDLLAALAAWGPCDSCPEDLDGDGLVTVTDLLTILAGWGSCGDR